MDKENFMSNVTEDCTFDDLALKMEPLSLQYDIPNDFCLNQFVDKPSLDYFCTDLNEIYQDHVKRETEQQLKPEEGDLFISDFDKEQDPILLPEVAISLETKADHNSKSDTSDVTTPKIKA